MKVFAEKKMYSASGLLLPFADFKLFSDVENPIIDKEKAEKIVKRAEGLLVDVVECALVAVVAKGIGVEALERESRLVGDSRNSTRYASCA